MELYLITESIMYDTTLHVALVEQLARQVHTFWNKSAHKFTRIGSKTDSLRKKITGIFGRKLSMHCKDYTGYSICLLACSETCVDHLLINVVCT